MIFMKTLLFALLILGAVYTKSAWGQSWQPVHCLPPQQKVDWIAVHPEAPRFYFVASGERLYFSENLGKNWKEVFALRPGSDIYDLYFDRDRIFLLSSEGLYESKNGKKWKPLFSGINKQHSARSMIRDPHQKNILYLGTDGGLFWSRDNGRKWEKSWAPLHRSFIHHLQADHENNELFLAADDGLYRLLPAQNRLDQVYRLRSVSLDEEEEGDVPDEFEDEQEIKSVERIRKLLVTPSSIVAVAMEHEILISEDEGNDWQRLSDSGLPKSGIRDVIYSKAQATFFAATDQGVYVYLPNEKRWKEMNHGLPATSVHRLTLTFESDEILYAATEQGLYRFIIDSSFTQPDQIRLASPERWNLLMDLFRFEPAIHAVQKEAIRYANVRKIKTERWQWTSRLKALVPSLSVGKDFSTGSTVDIDRGSTNEPDRYIIGPPDQSEGWGFDLNWELSDLIWNSAQTSIDSREKLMVELREDILGEVTRLYYERRRAQIELILRPPADSFDYANALIRIDELTAHLDGYTDGYFTRQLNQIYGQHREFETLWVMEYQSNSDSHLRRGQAERIERSSYGKTSTE